MHLWGAFLALAVSALSVAEAQCPVGYFLDAGQCVACPALSTSAPNSTTSAACVCVENTFRNGTLCVPCPRWTVSAQDATECHECPSGSFKGRRQCEPCPIGHFCVHSRKHRCPIHSNSTENASSINNCTCTDGFKKFDDPPALFGTQVHFLCMQELSEIPFGLANLIGSGVERFAPTFIIWLSLVLTVALLVLNHFE